MSMWFLIIAVFSSSGEYKNVVTQQMSRSVKMEQVCKLDADGTWRPKLYTEPFGANSSDLRSVSACVTQDDFFQNPPRVIITPEKIFIKK